MVAAAAFILSFPAPVHGQSFFEQLFGGFVPKPIAQPPQRPVLRLGVPESIGRGGSITQTETDDTRDPRKSNGGELDEKTANGGGQRQSICVRTCDGYYWPIRYPTSRRDLASDEAACRASCGTEAKLYTRANPGVPAEDMRDENGRAYADSPTAFVYRKRLVDGCACRPMPWSDSEVARHERYALIEDERRIRVAEAERQAKDADRIAAASSGASQITDQADAAEGAAAGGASGRSIATNLPTPTNTGQAGDPSASTTTEEAKLAAAELGKLTVAESARTAKSGSKSAARRDGAPGEKRRARFAADTQAAKRDTQRAGRPASRGGAKPGIYAVATGLPMGQPKFRYPGD
jgi:hypothetical protein